MAHIAIVQRVAALAILCILLPLGEEVKAERNSVTVELRNEVAVGKPANGFVGRLSVTPLHGPVGTIATVTATSLPAHQEFQLVWRTVKGSWNVKGPEYHGRNYEPVGYLISTVRSDNKGDLSSTFTVPEDFGFSHDIILQHDGRLFNQTAFPIDMTVNISPKKGPIGTPINVEVKGIGWRKLQNSWTLLYDNKFTGWISSVTTRGTAQFTIPASGHVGGHVLEIQHGAYTFPYRNMQQSPEPDRPTFSIPFTLTEGSPVLPLAPENQAQTNVRRLPPQGELVASRSFSTVGQEVTVASEGLKPETSYDLNWSSVTGNRIDGFGWEESSTVIAKAQSDALGKIAFNFETPDDLGGSHKIWIDDGPTKKIGVHLITPSAAAMDVDRGPAGTEFKIHLKGVGWTETANIYTIVYDNAYIGYSCGFNSGGDVEIFMKATGVPGWHFIDLYPAIYKGKERQPRNFRIPQLTYKDDHPGEDLPRFSFAFFVTSPAQGVAAK